MGGAELAKPWKIEINLVERDEREFVSAVLKHQTGNRCDVFSELERFVVDGCETAEDIAEGPKPGIVPATFESFKNKWTTRATELGITFSVSKAVQDWLDEFSADEDEKPSWIEKHSITCAICGNLADERECVETPEYFEGSICPNCVERAKKQGIIKEKDE